MAMDTSATATDPLAERSRSEQIRQVSHPCPKCGSYYRRGTACNICGEPMLSRAILREQIEQSDNSSATERIKQSDPSSATDQIKQADPSSATERSRGMPRQFSKHGRFHTMQKIIRY